MSIHDTLIKTPKEKKKRRKSYFYFISKRQLERSRMSKKTQFLSRIVVLVEIAKTLDFGSVNTEDRPLTMNLAMCKNLNVVNEGNEEEYEKEVEMVRYTYIHWYCFHIGNYV